MLDAICSDPFLLPDEAPLAKVDICPLYLVRTAGLPVASVHGLKASRLVDVLDEAAAHQRSMAEIAAGLANELHEAIAAIKGETDFKAETRLFIEAKRAIFNGKRVKNLDAVIAALGRHRAAAAPALRRWSALNEKYQDIRGSLAATLEAHAGEARNALRDISAIPRFADSLALVNPELAQQVAAFRRAAGGEIRHKDRQIEASLYQFVTRTATKPSPLSQLCVTSYGLMGPLACDCPPPGHAVARMRINLSLLARLRARAEVPLLQQGKLPIRLNSSVMEAGNRFGFLRTRLRPVQLLAVYSSVTTQGMFSVPRTRAAEALVRVLGGGVALPIEVCVAQLGAAGIDAVLARSNITQLLERGFLETCADTAMTGYDDVIVHSEEILRQAGFDTMAEAVQRLHDLAEGLGAASGPSRVHALQAARAAGAELCASVGLSAPSNASSVLVEDTILRGRSDAPDITDPALRAALEQLGPILPLLDGLLPTRLAVREAFIRQFGTDGTCHDVGLFADDIARLRNATHAEETGSLRARAPIDEALLSHAAPARQREMRQALAARRAAWLHVRRRALREAAGTVAFSASELAAFSAAVPVSARAGFGLAGLFLQADLRGGWVANQLAGGACQFMSRFIDHWALEGDPQPLQAARAYLRHVTPPGAAFAEISGHDDSTLNLHPCLTDLSMQIPQDRPTGTPVERIGLRDLCIRFDPRLGALGLYETASLRQLLPVYLGGLSSTLLPSLQQMLLLLGPTLRLPRLGWHHLLKDDTTDRLRALPELRIGALVLFRRSWMVPFSELSVPASATELESFERIRAWQQQNAIPPRCFAVLPESEGKQWRGSAWTKPSFVDFDSPHSVAWLVKEARNAAGHCFLSQANPDPVAARPEDCIREFILDLTIGDHHV